MIKKSLLNLFTIGVALCSFASVSAYDCCNTGCFGDVYLGADYLYWDVCASNQDYAIVLDGDPLSITGVVEGDYKYFDHGWQPGFRVYAGLDRFRGCWGLYGSYTRLKSEQEEALVRAGEFIYPTLSNPSLYQIPAIAVSDIYARNEIEYQTFDVLFSYDFECFGPCHLITPFWGIEGVKIDQQTTEHVATVRHVLFYDIDWQSDFKGLGLKVGSEYFWNIRGGFSFYADASFSIVAGHASSTNDQVLTNTLPVERIYKDSSCLCLPGGHLGVGLEYVYRFCNWHIGAKVGYEAVGWWNVPVQRRFVETDPLRQGISTSCSGGNLILHGLVAGVSAGF